MSALTSTEVLRPGPKGFKAWMQHMVFALMPSFFAFLRRWKPVMKLGNNYLTSRYDDVREVFATDPAFGVIYKPHLDVIMGGQPFFLGMADTDAYRHDTAAMRKVVRPDDLSVLAARTEAQAEAIVAGAGGRIDVVDTLEVRRLVEALPGPRLPRPVAVGKPSPKTISCPGWLKYAARYFCAIAIPTPFANPWPSGPVVISTPAVCLYSGWPGVLLCSWRKLRSSLSARS